MRSNHSYSSSGTFVRSLCLLMTTVILGCAQLPDNIQKTPSSALADYGDTSLAKRFADGEATHPGQSAFTLIRHGDRALAARLALIDAAEKSLDLQVYIWEPDESGVMIAERVVRAADRGVRVRLLVDDLGFGGEDAGFATLDAHENIEARLFNPFANRGFNLADFMFDLGRVNHRMHNKLLIADNSLAIVGGRNMGNHYFDVDPTTNFRDLDIGAAGPVVRDSSDVFDHFWNGRAAVPVSALVEETYTSADLTAMMVKVRQRIDALPQAQHVQGNVDELSERMIAQWTQWPWALGSIVWNRPDTVASADTEGEIIVALRQRLQNVEHTLLIESAYFVVRDGGVEAMRKLTERGVRVRVLTNSLLSNDVLAAHAGHAKYRKDLLRAGVEIYELRSDSGVIENSWRGESRAGLHTKALSFDNQALFVGSFNLDPRSANINTEAGIYVQSEELTAQLNEYLDEGASLQNSYKVTLDDNGDLLWTTIIDGETVTYDKDPGSTFGQRFTAGFIGILPIDSQL